MIEKRTTNYLEKQDLADIKKVLDEPTVSFEDALIELGIDKDEI